MSAFLGGGGFNLLFLVRRDADVLFLELGVVTLHEEKAVPVGAGEDLILKAEISHSEHRERLIHFRMNKQPPVIMWSYDLWEQNPVLHTVGNNQMATLQWSSSMSACWSKAQHMQGCVCIPEGLGGLGPQHSHGTQ